MSDESFETVEPDDEAYELSRRDVDAVLEAVEQGARDALIARMEPMHAADIADMLEQISSADRYALIELYGVEFDGDILSELDESIREDVISALRPEVLAEAVRELESDDVVDLLEDLEAPQQEAIFEALDDADAVIARQALSYPEESAGRLMQREVVAAPEHWTVGDAIDFMRSSEDLPEQFYHVVLVDPRMHPVGNVTLGRIMGAPRKQPLHALVEDVFQIIPVDQDEGDVAYAFNQYHLISAPVVDDEGRLVGVITIDDAMAVLDEEHEEDIMRLAGVGEGSLTDRVISTTRRRFPWLAVNLVTAVLASLVIAQFEGVISDYVALAVLMPIVASMGGNAGTQTVTVAVRALAMREFSAKTVWSFAGKELTVGLMNGLFFALLAGGLSWLWFRDLEVATILAVAMLVNLIIAALSGLLVPLGLQRVGVDPAVASSVLLTTITDVVGFFVFLGLAAVFLL